ncbi:MAG TPA: DUF3857 domain-containing protein [Candidatus Solibacter sp.]|nr:DUF3857 domain-containing protein [Candidatus Solibacter sp.]
MRCSALRVTLKTRIEPHSSRFGMFLIASPRTLRTRRGRHSPRRILAGLLLCLAGPLSSTCFASSEDWLPIAPADLALRSNPADPAAHAMVLYSETRVDMEKGDFFTYVRIKIFDEAGRKFADADAEYGNELYSVEDLRARTVHPDGSIVEFSGQPTPLRRRDIGGDRPVVALTCPAATPGSIVEYRYRIHFHRERYAGRRVNYVQSKEEYAQILTETRHLFWRVRGELYVRRARYIVHPYQVPLPGFAVTGGVRPGYPKYRTENLPEGTSVVVEKLGTLVCEASDVAALPAEPYPPRPSLSDGRIEMYFTEHKQETQREFWERFATLAREREAYAFESLKLAKKIAEQTVEGADGPEARLRKLYARAQKIRNLSFDSAPALNPGKDEPAMIEPHVEEVLARNEAHASGVNLAFVALARAAGFEAQMIRLAPRNHRPFDMNRLDSTQLETSAVWVRLQGKDLVLDPGTRFCPFGLLPWPKMSASGFQVTKIGIRPLTTPGPSPSDARIERKADLELSADGSLRGSVQADFYGQEALEIRIEALGMDEAERKELLAGRLLRSLPAGSKIETISAADWETAQEQFHALFTVSIPPQKRNDGNFSAVLTPTVAGQANPFGATGRADAVAMPYPYREADENTIHLPPGMGVEELPALREARLKLPGQIVSEPENGETTGLRRRQPGDVDVAVYQNLRKENGETITAARLLISGVGEVAVAQYPRLREFFEQVREADSETVRLRAGPN